VEIAVFYGSDIHAAALLAAAAAVAGTLLLRHTRIDWPPIYVALAVAAWYATYHSGVHATIAGVALAFTTPAKPLAPTATAQRWAQDLSDEPTASEIHQMTIIARESVSPAEHLEELLHPTTSFFILPVFALANAGVELRADMLDGRGAARVAAGVMIGLVAGKLVGILAGAWFGVRLGVAGLPAGLRWRHIAGAAALGGIGFTVSLFIAGLAFTDPELADAARIAVLSASVVSAGIGAAILATARRAAPTHDAP
jgi:NhaA family Na+:H+ antiporter